MKKWQNPEIKALDVQETFGGPKFIDEVDFTYYDEKEGRWVDYLGEQS